LEDLSGRSSATPNVERATLRAELQQAPERILSSFGTTSLVQVMNYIFAFIFTVECVTKLLALGDVYFDDSWNVFDFTIVAGTNSSRTRRKIACSKFTR
jgi:hypothetical protein